MDNNNELDNYLATEFPDDRQTDQQKRVLSNYLKEIFPDATTPQLMKERIDEVDRRVKAFYLLTAQRAAVQENTTLKRVEGLSKEAFAADSENRNALGQVQSAVGSAGWPHTASPSGSGPKFVFDTPLLRKVYNDNVREKVKVLFARGKRTGNSRRQLLARLGNQYGLQRSVDMIERPPNQIPAENAESMTTDEHIVETNLFRFAMFGPQNSNNLLFEPTARNIEALNVTQTTLFDKEEFPKNISASVSDFVNRAETQMSQSPEQQTIAADEQGAEASPAQQVQPDVPDVAPVPAAEPSPVVANADQSTDQLLNQTFDAARPSDCDATEQNLQALEDRYAGLAQKIGQYNTASEEAVVLLQSQKTLIDELRKNQAAGGQAQAQLEADLEKCQAEKNVVSEERDNLEQERNRLNEQLAETGGESATLKAVIDGLKGAIDAQEKKLDDLQDAELRIEESLYQIEPQDGAVQKLEQLKNRLQQRAGTVVDRIAELQRELQVQQEMVSQLEQRRDDLQQQLEQAQQRIDTLESQINDLGGQERDIISKLGVASREFKQQVANYSTFCQEMAEKLQSLLDRASQLETGLDAPITALQEAIKEAQGSLAQTGAAAASSPAEAAQPAATMGAADEIAGVADAAEQFETGAPVRPLQSAPDPTGAAV